LAPSSKFSPATHLCKCTSRAKGVRFVALDIS